ncbi:hypothetical protein Pfo_011378 [Paulownia fortunei]|nr:hypothetical protein Pfo_011378 [Paulownia fortunei]
MIVNNVDIWAPDDSPNTDGTHIVKSNNKRITDSHISTGDNCISMGDRSTNINITLIWCWPGHKISIGTLGKYKNCTFTNTDTALRIQTWAPSSVPSTVFDVTFADIHYYCSNSSCSHKGESEVENKGVKFINIRGRSASAVAVNVQCNKSRPCQNIQFMGLDLAMKGTRQLTIALCSNANHKFLGPHEVFSHCS